MSKRSVVPAAILAILLVAALLGACSVGQDISGSGDIVSEEHEAEGVTQVELNAPGELRIVAGTSERLLVETDENIIEYVEVNVRGDTLEIGLDAGMLSRVRPTRLDFELEIPALETVAVSGSGTVEADGFEADSLEVTISGSGSVSMDDLDCETLRVGISGSGTLRTAGTCSDQEVDISGSGDYNASDLQAETASVSVSGSGRVAVWVTEELDANVSGSGDIEYYGSPRVVSSRSGSGEIRSKGDR